MEYEYEAVKEGVKEGMVEFLNDVQNYYHEYHRTQTAPDQRFIVYDAIYQGMYDAVTKAIDEGKFKMKQ